MSTQSSIRINCLRLSFLWTEVFDSLLEGGAPNAHFAALGSAIHYEACFERARKGELPHRLTLPWPMPPMRGSTGGFWRYFLCLRGDPGDPGAVMKGHARKMLVPLRWVSPPLPFSLRPVSTDARLVSQEAFVSPFSISYVLTFDLGHNRRAPGQDDLKLSLDEVVKIARGLRYGQRLLRSGHSDPQTMEAVKNDAFEVLAQRTLGPEAMYIPFKGSPKPFSIATVIRAQGCDPPVTITDGCPEHRVLHALASWDAGWSDMELPPLGERRLPVRRGSDGRVLYAEPHGRVAWFPVLFQSPAGSRSLEAGGDRLPKKKRISLSTYHRNLLLSALQTERLIGLTKLVADRLEAGQPPGIELSDYARFAAGILDRLYRGDPRTYRTSSIKARIDANESDRESIDRVRKWVGMDPLAA